jgi:hypothetical protein
MTKAYRIGEQGVRHLVPYKCRMKGAKNYTNSVLAVLETLFHRFSLRSTGKSDTWCFKVNWKRSGGIKRAAVGRWCGGPMDWVHQNPRLKKSKTKKG